MNITFTEVLIPSGKQQTVPETVQKSVSLSEQACKQQAARNPSGTIEKMRRPTPERPYGREETQKLIDQMRASGISSEQVKAFIGKLMQENSIVI